MEGSGGGHCNYWKSDYCLFWSIGYKKRWDGLARLFSRWQHLSVLLRTWVQFPALWNGNRQPTVIVPGEPIPSSSLHTCRQNTHKQEIKINQSLKTEMMGPAAKEMEISFGIWSSLGQVIWSVWLSFLGGKMGMLVPMLVDSHKGWVEQQKELRGTWIDRFSSSPQVWRQGLLFN